MNWIKVKKRPLIVEAYQTDKVEYIETLQGIMKADIGDWIIKGVNGELYSCKPDIFEKTYDIVDESEALFNVLVEEQDNDEVILPPVKKITIKGRIRSIEKGKPSPIEENHLREKLSSPCPCCGANMLSNEDGCKECIDEF